jgi:hypothetical protein
VAEHGAIVLCSGDMIDAVLAAAARHARHDNVLLLVGIMFATVARFGSDEDADRAVERLPELLNIATTKGPGIARGGANGICSAIHEFGARRRCLARVQLLHPARWVLEQLAARAADLGLALRVLVTVLGERDDAEARARRREAAAEVAAFPGYARLLMQDPASRDVAGEVIATVRAAIGGGR